MTYLILVKKTLKNVDYQSNKLYNRFVIEYPEFANGIHAFADWAVKSRRKNDV